MQPYARRRAALLRALAGGAAIIPGARQVARSNDTDFPFRQNSDFYYLTGFDEPDAVLLLLPEQAKHRVVLFVRELDRTQELWNGKRLGTQAAPILLGVDVAHPIGELEVRLSDYLVGATTVHYRFGESETFDRTVLGAVAEAGSKTRRSGRAPERYNDPGMLLHAMRAIKDPEELAIMRRAAQATQRGHLAAMRATRPGVHEYEIEAIMECEFALAGARSPAYESIVGSGDNATILHYITNRDLLRDGQLLLVDAAAEIDCYTTDVTRTWAVSGRFTAEQRAIYEIVLAAQKAGIAQVRPGNPQRAFGNACLRVIVEGLIEIGLLHGSADENIEAEKYRDFYMHGAGHWLGLDVHDVGRYRDDDDEPVLLQAGMVTTVEPGIYVHRDLACDERFKGIGVRIEDDIVVTADGNENLTQAIPKEIDEIEAVVGSAAHAISP
ncbi:MAG TPA: aminopeptidase P N-terminal domain-containing protein [Candidatus Baltobacteraceae bacterium]